MHTLHLLNLSNFPIFSQLEIEEALLRASSLNVCIINKGSPPSIVLGISNRYEDYIMPNNSLPAIQRFSGGGTVVVDEDTIFLSFICQNDFIQSIIFPDILFKWSSDLYKNALNLDDFHYREHDYVIGKYKCGGNAQYLRKDRFVHHTSFLWDYKKELMSCLKQPPKMPSYRAARPHSDFLCKLCDFFPSKKDFIDRIQSALQKRFLLQPLHLEDICPLLYGNYRRSTKYLKV